jgi:hypothetical protein
MECEASKFCEFKLGCKVVKILEKESDQFALNYKEDPEIKQIKGS